MSAEPIAWLGDKRPEDAPIEFRSDGTLVLRQSAYFPGVSYGPSDGTEAPFRMMRSGEIVDQRVNAEGVRFFYDADGNPKIEAVIDPESFSGRKDEMVKE